MKSKSIESKERAPLRCPHCKSAELTATEAEAGLRFFSCLQCQGNWIRGAEYWKWLEERGPNLPERWDQDSGLSLAESGSHIDCPECRFRLVKYLVGHGFSFTIDHCEGCRGSWLEKNEWEALRERNLHDDLHAMFTSFWQDEAEKGARKKRLERIYMSRFGEDDYTEIERVRQWLATRPNRQELLAYLTDKDPFDV